MVGASSRSTEASYPLERLKFSVGGAAVSQKGMICCAKMEYFPEETARVVLIYKLAGWFQRWLFSPRKLGKMNLFGEHIFQRGWLIQPPTGKCFFYRIFAKRAWELSMLCRPTAEADKILTSPRSDASTLTFDEGLRGGEKTGWGKMGTQIQRVRFLCSNFVCCNWEM